MIKKRESLEDIGESPLKRLRDELGMSQEEFARYIGTSARTVSRWESGDTMPNFTIRQMKAMERLLKSIDKTLSDLPDSFAPAHTINFGTRQDIDT
jgi:DNA-binding transcriptional regulator YiaG